jgi:predicted ATPase
VPGDRLNLFFAWKVVDSPFLWRLYHFHDTSVSSPMKATADLHDNRFLRPDGSNLAAFLYFLQQKHSSSYQLIRKTVQRIAPFFDDFQLEPLLLNLNKIQLEWRHKGSDSYFDASMLSDGTLRFMALATLLLQPQQFRPSVILVDEPELGLHPYAITQLASLVKAASAQTQVILSTQSPHLLDHFEPEDVLVAERVDGGTTLRRLDPEPLATWLDAYSLGQLWEKNEIGGRPGAE